VCVCVFIMRLWLSPNKFTESGNDGATRRRNVFFYFDDTQSVRQNIGGQNSYKRRRTKLRYKLTSASRDGDKFSMLSKRYLTIRSRTCRSFSATCRMHAYATSKRSVRPSVWNVGGLTSQYNENFAKSANRHDRIGRCLGYTCKPSRPWS